MNSTMNYISTYGSFLRLRYVILRERYYLCNYDLIKHTPIIYVWWFINFVKSPHCIIYVVMVETFWIVTNNDALVSLCWDQSLTKITNDIIYELVVGSHLTLYMSEWLHKNDLFSSDFLRVFHVFFSKTMLCDNQASLDSTSIKSKVLWDFLSKCVKPLQVVMWVAYFFITNVFSLHMWTISFIWN